MAANAVMDLAQTIRIHAHYHHKKVIETNKFNIQLLDLGQSVTQFLFVDVVVPTFWGLCHWLHMMTKCCSSTIHCHLPTTKCCLLTTKCCLATSTQCLPTTQWCLPTSDAYQPLSDVYQHVLPTNYSLLLTNHCDKAAYCQHSTDGEQGLMVFSQKVRRAR